MSTVLTHACRQQREEIIRKQEKLDVILKKKKPGDVRPESPGSRRRKTRKAQVSTAPRRFGSRNEVGGEGDG